jgi:hypothetical protein
LADRPSERQDWKRRNQWARQSLVRIVLCAALISGLRSLISLGQKPVVYKGKKEKLPLSVAPQPVAFSHKKHYAVGLSCPQCHTGATESEQAGFPNTDECMLCHATMMSDSPEVKKLADAHRRKEKVRWVRVYKVPEFVFFSHASHLKAGQQCATCHGPVDQRDVLTQEISTSMTSCMNCHATKAVSNDCSLCHQLGH